MKPFLHLPLITQWFDLPPTSPNYKLITIKGGAGTGKTQMIIEIVKAFPGQTAVVAPTNKAAKVPRERGVAATTIHSLCFAVIPTGRFTTTKSLMIDATGRMVRDPTGQPVYKEADEEICHYEFDEDVIHKRAKHEPGAPPLILIIDESSMVGCAMWYNLMRTSSAIRIIAIGDHNQLPPPNEDEENDPRWRPFQDFFCNSRADITLTTNHRQMAGSGIIDVLGNILSDGIYPSNPECADVIVANVPLRAASKILADADIVIAHRRACASRCNAIIRDEIHKEAFAAEEMCDPNLPRVGDKLYVTSTLREDRQIIVTKGDILTITAPPVFDLPEGIAIITGDCDDGRTHKALPIDLGFVGRRKRDRKMKAARCDYGFALTCQKSQGSQWDRVVVIDERLPYSRTRWLYTACSRAVKELIILSGGGL